MKPARTTPVRALDHAGATRPNIPTAELESFARPEEKRPTLRRYPRDPTLDPQLVWKGKDEQDGHDLEVPAVPIYIGETIDPLALVEELRAASEGRRSEEQLGFFGPYSDLSFDEKEGLKGQVQTIYVDPPYGIKRGVGPLGATSAIGRVSVTAGGLTAAIVQSYCVG